MTDETNNPMSDTSAGGLSATERPWDWWKAPEERERRRRQRDLTRNYFKQATIDLAKPIQAARFWLLPWTSFHYPGRGRGLRQIAGNRVIQDAVDKWCRTSDAPLWALHLIAGAIKARLDSGQAVYERVLALIAEKELRGCKPGGLQIIDEVTGLPKYRNTRGRAAEVAKRGVEASTTRLSDREV